MSTVLYAAVQSLLGAPRHAKESKMGWVKECEVWSHAKYKWNLLDVEGGWCWHNSINLDHVWGLCHDCKQSIEALDKIWARELGWWSCTNIHSDWLWMFWDNWQRGQGSLLSSMWMKGGLCVQISICCIFPTITMLNVAIALTSGHHWAIDPLRFQNWCKDEQGINMLELIQDLGCIAFPICRMVSNFVGWNVQWFGYLWRAIIHCSMITNVINKVSQVVVLGNSEMVDCVVCITVYPIVNENLDAWIVHFEILDHQLQTDIWMCWELGFVWEVE